MIYILFNVTGEMELVQSDKPISLEATQKIVGGYVEHYKVPHQNGPVFVMCEDGRLKGFPQNRALPQFVGNVLMGRYKATIDGYEFVGINEF